MLSFVINLDQRKANNYWVFIAYFVNDYNSFPEFGFRNKIVKIQLTMEATPPQAHSGEFTWGQEIAVQLFAQRGRGRLLLGEKRGPFGQGRIFFCPATILFYAWRFILSGSIMQTEKNLRQKELLNLERLEKTLIPNPANRNREM